MLKKVHKIKNGLNGEFSIPADKSISHRAIMFPSLSKGSCTVRNLSIGADCQSTLSIFKQLGIDITYIDNKTVKIKSNGILHKPSTDLNVGNSGTTTRLLAGILAGQDFDSRLIGDESLSKRPMKRIIEPLTLMGADIESDEGHAPLTIHGKKLRGIEYNSKLASAQVKSCILLAGLNAEGNTVYTEPYISRNHTEILLKYLGADISVNNNTVIIKPSELYSRDISVVGDISSAAFFITAGLIIPNSNILIKNVGINDTRAGIIDVAERMCGNIEIINKTELSGEPVADIRVQYTESLKSCIIQGEDIPRLIDELPVIAVLASQADGVTVVKNAEDLRNKESDRIKCLVSELSKIGINIKETVDGFIIEGGGKSGCKSSYTNIPGGAVLNSYNDHRLAMSFYVAGLIAEKEIAIDGFEWTKISFPEFEELMHALTDEL